MAKGFTDCVHSQVGRSLIADLNLTRMAPTQSEGDCCSHAFMSLRDFASVASARKGVLLQLLERFPDVVWGLWQGSDLYQHAVRLMDAAHQHAIIAYLDSVWRNVLLMSNSSAPPAAENRTGFTAAELEAVRRIVRDHRKQAALFYAYSGGSIVSRAAAAAVEETADIQRKSEAVGQAVTGRRLLQTMGTVDTYTSLVASSQGFSNLAIASFQRSSSQGVPLVTETWLEGPFGWPPKYATLEEAGQCPVGDQLLQSAGEVCMCVCVCVCAV